MCYHTRLATHLPLLCLTNCSGPNIKEPLSMILQYYWTRWYLLEIVFPKCLPCLFNEGLSHLVILLRSYSTFFKSPTAINKVPTRELIVGPCPQTEEIWQVNSGISTVSKDVLRGAQVKPSYYGWRRFLEACEELSIRILLGFSAPCPWGLMREHGLRTILMLTGCQKKK